MGNGLRTKTIDKSTWVKDLKDGAVMGNHSEPEVTEFPPFIPCKCFDETTKRYCKDKRICCKVEAQ